jgi:FKBP-type peptidyl-prolyl cis-trans isomerase
VCCPNIKNIWMSKLVNLVLAVFIISTVLLSLNACKSKTRSYSAKEQNEIKENLLKANRGLVAKDQEDIAAYASQKQWNMQKTETGLWYEIITNANGRKANSGMVAHLSYTVNLLDGTLCYSSDSLGIKTFKIGQGGVESGLEEGVLMLSEGDVARFIMPPHLAHGLLGDENKIPSRSTIVYNIELLKLTDY